MITNQKQYKITKGQIDRLKGALSATRKGKEKMSDKIYKAMIAGIQSQIKDLEKELLAYDKLSKVKTLDFSNFEDLPELLIKTRIAKGYTQEDLAKLINVKSQQIQRYEATSYKTANFLRILSIIKALDIKFKRKVPLLVK